MSTFLKCLPFRCRRQPPRKILYIFDFDDTIVEKNSETIYKTIISEKKGCSENQLPRLPTPLQWGHISPEFIDYMFDNFEITAEDILEYVRKNIYFVPGMDKVLRKVYANTLKNSPNCRLLVMSGSNELIIKTKLDTINVVPNDIIANHATLSADKKKFKYSYKNFENDVTEDNNNGEEIEEHICSFCKRAYCKGLAYERYVAEHGQFDEVHFICDGTNDICLCLRLRPTDYVYVRVEYGFDCILRHSTTREMKPAIPAQIRYWETGYDLYDEILPRNGC